METFLDPAITGGVFGVIFGAFKLVEKSLNGKDNSNNKIKDAEWRTNVANILGNQTEIAKRQTKLLEDHCKEAHELSHILMDVHKNVCKD